jgi:tetratricopeptide (TPR) repeat protein
MREHLQKAIALRPDFPEPYNLLAFISLVTGKDIDEAITSLKRVMSSLPGNHQGAFMLGQLYLRKNEFKSAREMLEQVTKSNADEGTRKNAEQLLGAIRTMEEQGAQVPAMKQSGGATSTEVVSVTRDPETTKQPPPDPSSYLREVLRKPAAGETQLQGTLVKIECDAKGIVFVVKTATGLLRLRTATFDQLELTTYDPAVKGDITCGERKPENEVVVSYVPNADKRVKADGVLKSIEFVPADFKLK